MKLSPYGSPPMEIPLNYDQPMDDWDGTPEEWQTFFDQFVKDVKANIWPEWNKANGCWEGDAADFAEEATRLENQICINHLQKAGILEQKPNTPHFSGPDPQKNHYWHYSVEDFIGKFGVGSPFEVRVQQFPVRNVAYYDDQIVPEEMDALFGLMFNRKYRGTFTTKLYFRRPRPQQTAFVFGQHDFVHRQARANIHTGNHPALISGHCAQGLLLMCVLVDKLLSEGKPVEDIRLDAYAQYAVDFGDRRVFAGVHYLTDNLASWTMVLRLIPRVFAQNAEFLEDFIRNAIKTRSTVYRLMDQHFEGHEALQKPLSFLRTNVG